MKHENKLRPLPLDKRPGLLTRCSRYQLCPAMRGALCCTVIVVVLLLTACNQT